ncbi:MAG: hypothetical protein LBL01_06195, partial [Bifidobacteriaceae bacterium]|nr:hypothetical protein [Bifidobacteriaceae bacterium]
AAPAGSSKGAGTAAARAANAAPAGTAKAAGSAPCAGGGAAPAGPGRAARRKPAGFERTGGFAEFDESAEFEDFSVDPEELQRKLHSTGLTDPEQVRSMMGETNAQVRDEPPAAENRRQAEYRELARDRRAFAAQLLQLYNLAGYPGPLGEAAAERVAWLEELEAIAELNDRTGGERAVLAHIQLLRTVLA